MNLNLFHVMIHLNKSFKYVQNLNILINKNRYYSSKKHKKLLNIPLRWSLYPDIPIPDTLLPHEIDKVEKMFKVPSKMIYSTSFKNKSLPPWKLPEFAFAGRSNVGKSSLINKILDQHGFVKTSKTPGRTQKLDFISIGGEGLRQKLSIVDMPGYGFATTTKSVVDQWHKLVGYYIENRKINNLKNIFLLIDSRHGVKNIDEEFMDFLDMMKTMYQIVLTKADSVTYNELQEKIKLISEISKKRNRLSMNPIVHVTSSKENLGILEIRNQIAYLSCVLDIAR